MNEERANEIIRKVFYANFNMLPPIDEKNGETAFHIGRMLGKMQKVLEIELEKETNKECKEIESVRKEQTKIKVGDKVRTLKERDMRGNKLFPIGTIGKVTCINEDDKLSYEVDYGFWYSRDMLEVVDDEVKDGD